MRLIDSDNVCSWEDGNKVSKTLDAPDRWEVHAAERVVITLGDYRVCTVQEPHGLTGGRIGVGACVWDGALLLAGYLASQPHYKFVGARCIELGAGVGFVSIILAKMGAHVIASDIQKVLPLLEKNLIENDVLRKSRSFTGGGVEIEELEWGKEGWLTRVETLRHPSPDYILAADCCYIDNDGISPSTPAFVQTCARLAGPNTKTLVAFERRSPQVRKCLLDEASKLFTSVTKLSLHNLPIPLRLEYCDLWELKL